MNSLKLCLIALFFLLGCAKDEKLLVIECFSKDTDKSRDTPVFIWYKSNINLLCKVYEIPFFYHHHVMV